MCKSIAEGGRRCAGHLEPAFTKAIKAYHDGGDELTNEMMHKILAPAKAYASTRAGASVINKMIDAETTKQLEGAYNDYQFSGQSDPIAKVLQGMGEHRRFYDARKYLTANLPFLALLQIALEDGQKISRDYQDREYALGLEKQKQTEALKKKTLLPKESSKFKAAYTEIENAIKNGSPIAAPAGSIGFKLTYNEDDYDGYHNEYLGIYQSVADAKRSAVSKLLAIFNIDEGWRSSLEITTPWGSPVDMGINEWNKAKIDWFKSKSDDELIAWAKTKMAKEIRGGFLHSTFSATTFDIDPITIETVETAYPEETHLED